jgi:hypothetical protein
MAWFGRKIMLRMTSGFRIAPLVAVLAVSAFAQDPATRAASLLAEARKAVGGEERLRAVRTLQARGDFKRIAGQNTIEGELTLLVELPDKLRREEDLSPPGGGPAVVRTEVVNGADTWDENSGGGGQFVFRRGGPDGGGGRDGRGEVAAGGRGGRAPLDPEQLRQLQLRARRAELVRLSLALLLNTGDAVTWVGTAESPDGKADVLEVKPAEGAAMRLFLDASTHLPLMITWQGAAPQVFFGRRGRGAPDAQGAPLPATPPRPEQATLRLTLGDYKAVNGLKLPHLMTRGANDETTEEWTVSSYRINPSLKSDTFIKK